MTDLHRGLLLHSSGRRPDHAQVSLHACPLSCSQLRPLPKGSLSLGPFLPIDEKPSYQKVVSHLDSENRCYAARQKGAAKADASKEPR